MILSGSMPWYVSLWQMYKIPEVSILLQGSFQELIEQKRPIFFPIYTAEIVFLNIFLA
jgi:hypothetical protein